MARRAIARGNAPRSRRSLARAVILVGFMGAGKTSVGKALAERLGWPFEDLDDRIERREGLKIAEIFRRVGESDFRRAEHEALEELLDEVQNDSKRIVALGGGAFVQESNMALIASAEVTTVFLDADVGELWSRCQGEASGYGTERPLLRNAEDFRSLYEARRPKYLKASVRQETDGKAIAEIARELIRTLGLNPRRENQEKF